jgi:4a-hydroxytetrahydrobiopterin dehydratase
MKKPVLLKKSEINKELKKVDSWQLNSKATIIHKTVTFKEHLDALVFIARATVHAQVLNHHPDIEFSFKKVKVSLTTLDIKGLSKIDFDLAKRIDLLSKVDKNN